MLNTIWLDTLPEFILLFPSLSLMFVVFLSFHFRCSPCVSTDGICGWCQLDFTCTGDNSTCTGGHDNWIRVRPYNIKV